MRYLIPDIILSLVSTVIILLKNHGKIVIRGFGTIISPDCIFEESTTIYGGCRILSSSIGKMTYVGQGSRIAHSKIGKFCSISQEVIIGPGRHPISDFFSTHPAFFSTRKQSSKTYVKQNLFEEFSRTTIGNDVMIGARAIVLDGVKIADGVIIGAGAVVTKDIPPYAIVGGVPAKIIKYRFSKPAIDYLTKIKWWNMRAKPLKIKIKEINKYVGRLNRIQK